LIRPTVREIANLRKADKSILFQIVLGNNTQKGTSLKILSKYGFI
jgi:hypothetical protein